jgi:hypothetical protein
MGASTPGFEVPGSPAVLLAALPCQALAGPGQGAARQSCGLYGFTTEAATPQPGKTPHDDSSSQLVSPPGGPNGYLRVTSGKWQPVA